MKVLFDRQIYQHFTQTHLLMAKRFIWIATANIKGTGVQFQKHFMSFPDFMSVMSVRGVSFRIIHSEIPSAPFRERYEMLDKHGELSNSVEFLHCIKMHSKIFIVDGVVALMGSPNLTGAGIGAKAGPRRNFEVAVLFEDEEETTPFVDYFDNIWMGAQCPRCGRRDICPAPAG